MIDTARIKVFGGRGGNGCISFKHTRAQPKGGPDGGDGGNGGSVYAVGDDSLNTLLHLRYQQLFKAGMGRHGGGKGKTGARGKDLIVNVPLGTLIWKPNRDGAMTPVADVLDDTPVLLARGGSAGRGNSRFVSSVNQIPLLAEGGEDGELSELFFELKVLADVGIIGIPNAGKSTLLSTCSAAKPRVANYPFTTLTPVLGMVEQRQEGFLLVEIPGLIEGAHQGVGLGHEFLRHVSRTRLLWHLVDGMSDNVVDRLDMVNRELGLFNHELADKPQVLVVNKVDMMSADRRREVEDILKLLGVPFFFISAITGEGVEHLVEETLRMVDALPQPMSATASATTPTIRPEPVRHRPRVWRDEDAYVVDSPRANRLLVLANLKDRRVQVQLWRELKRMGLAAELEKAGVQTGDTVRMGKVEMEWE